MNLRPDPTFYPSPKLAMQAPVETLAYTLMLGLRRLGLAGTRWAQAQTETIRRQRPQNRRTNHR